MRPGISAMMHLKSLLERMAMSICCQRVTKSLINTVSPKYTMFGFAVTCEGGEYKLVEGLPVDAFSQECINKTLKELQDEQAGVAHLL